jgi:large subunit ribosomal protein L17
LPKAKELVRFIEPLITLAKKNTLAARRLVIARLRDRLMADPKDVDMLLDDSVVQKLFKDIAPVYADRHGGYTRIVKTAKWRIGDAGDIVIVQLVDIAKTRTRSSTRPVAATDSTQ